jgi:uncharacterized delta-60 repeat protein
VHDQGRLQARFDLVGRGVAFEALIRPRRLAVTLAVLALTAVPTVARADTFDSPRAVASQSDGKIVVAGLSGGQADFALARVNPDGTLDSTFGTNGRVVTNFGNPPSTQASAVAVQRDGKIVAAGLATAGGTPLARYRPDGTLDPTFGSGGTEKLDPDLFDGSDLYPTAITVLRTGRILVAGFACTSGCNPRTLFILRLNPNGTIDPTFGSAGEATLGNSLTTYGYFPPAFGVDESGRIYVAAGTYPTPSNGYPDRFLIARFGPAGHLDSSFGQGGTVETAMSPRAPGIVQNAAANHLAIRPGGGIYVLGGYRWQPASGGNPVDTGVLLAYHEDGSLDANFGTGGRVEVGSTPISGFEGSTFRIYLPTGVVASSAGVFVSGWADSPSTNTDIGLAKYTSDGTLEHFSQSGFTSSNENDDPFSLTEAPGGRVVAAAEYGCCSPPRFDFELAAYNSNGTLDTSFCTTGLTTIDFTDLNALGTNCGVGPPPPTGSGGAGNVGGGGSGDPPAVVDEPDNSGCAAPSQPPIDPNDPPQWVKDAAADTAGQFTDEALSQLLNQSPHLSLFLQAYKFGSGVGHILHWFTETKELVARWQDRPCRAAYINDLDDPNINPSSSDILENDLVGLSNGSNSWSSLDWSEKTDELNLEIAECALSHNGQVTNCAGEEAINKLAVPLIMAWWGT